MMDYCVESNHKEDGDVNVNWTRRSVYSFIMILVESVGGD